MSQHETRGKFISLLIMLSVESPPADFKEAGPRSPERLGFYLTLERVHLHLLFFFPFLGGCGEGAGLITSKVKVGRKGSSNQRTVSKREI